MCGISGVISFSKKSIKSDKLVHMTNSLKHRGPDNVGYWVSDDRKIGLGHTRLSIIDLSKFGSQPIFSQSKRYVLVYNGEIYNHITLKEKLGKNINFKGSSDTETLINCIDTWGVEKTLTLIDGMFSIAIWDKFKEELHLIRDRFGIKPLYFMYKYNQVIFSSELKPIIIYLNKVPEISPEGFSEYVKYGYVPNELSIFENIYKVKPGFIYNFRNNSLNKQRYWNLKNVIIKSKQNLIKSSDEALDYLENKITKSVSMHTISDRPIGALLSGGIDSSLITAIMQKNSSKKIKTFSIGFFDKKYDEAQFSSKIANYLNTDHEEFYVNQKETVGIIQHLPQVYDEPFADTSQIPTTILTKMVRDKVVVALSGDGGDELFSGYNRYLFISDFYKKINIMPLGFRKFFSSLITKIPSSKWDQIFENFNFMMPNSFIPALPGQKMYKLASILSCNNLEEIYTKLICQWSDNERVINKEWYRQINFEKRFNEDGIDLNHIEKQMIWDTNQYLVDDILTKVDRSSMNVGLEVRVPFLNKDLYEASWRIPFDLKIYNGTNKWILKQILYKYVPENFYNRPKMGFDVPIDKWLREGLKDWAHSLLTQQKNNYFNQNFVEKIWYQHLSKNIDAGGKLWTLLMFEIWMEKIKSWI